MEVVQVMFENHAMDLIGDISINLLCGDNSYISIEHLVYQQQIFFVRALLSCNEHVLRGALYVCNF